MQVIHPCCCGLDIHKKFLVACVLATAPDGQVTKEVRTFSTMTDDLLALLDWLSARDCTHLAMESTGDYWKPIHNLLAGSFEVWLLNAQHIKTVPVQYPEWK
jgi:transposase